KSRCLRSKGAWPDGGEDMGGRSREPAAGTAKASPEEAPRPRGSRSGGRKKRARRGPLARLAYWTLVLGLWAVIGGVATIAFVASTLPPIQSLAVPKPPPTAETVRPDRKPLAT